MFDNKQKDKKVLVTGGAGYIGSVLCGHLLDCGYQVTVLDNLLYRQQTLFHFCSNPDFEFVFGDVRNKELMRKLLKDADVIIPLAAIVGAPACDLDPQLAISINLDSIRLLNNLRSKHQKIIYPNTNSGYGTKSGEIFCTEETILEPISLYGKTKAKAEAELLEKENTVTLRLATVFGMSPRIRLDLLVNQFVYEAVTDGYIVIFEKDFKRNFVHIQDIAECFEFCIENFDNMKGKTFNVGLDSANLSKKDLALKIKIYVPNFYIRYSEIRSDPDKRNYIVSNQRLKEAGFEAKYTLDQGIKELIKGYQMMHFKEFRNV